MPDTDHIWFGENADPDASPDPARPPLSARRLGRLVPAGDGTFLIQEFEDGGSRTMSDHPDAELLRLCAEFDALERQIDAIYKRGNSSYIEDDDERDPAIRL